MDLRSFHPSPLAVFRCDATPEIGSGHLTRCESLAEALRALGWRTIFAMRGQSLPTATTSSNPQGFIALTGDPENEPWEIARGLPGPVDLLIVDHYQRGQTFTVGCRGWVKRVMVISDFADRRYDADILLDNAFGREAADYGSLVPASCRILTGSDFALLRPPFAAARLGAIARRANSSPVSRLLVAMGAGDTSTVTAKVLDAMAAIPARIAVDVVLGAGTGEQAAIAERVAALLQPSRLHVGVGIDTMADLMTRADLAIGAGGTMSWERCCLGLPTLVITTGENQEWHARNLAAAGAIWLLGRDDEVTADTIAEDLLTLLSEWSTRQRTSTAAAAVCDGNGAARLAAIIDDMVFGDAAPREPRSVGSPRSAPDRTPHMEFQLEEA